MIGSLLASILALASTGDERSSSVTPRAAPRRSASSTQAICGSRIPTESDPRRLTVLRGPSNPIRASRTTGIWIAFTGQYAGNADVYVVSVDGGDPTAISPTSRSRSSARRGRATARKCCSARVATRACATRRLWVIDRTGGFPEALPLPMAERGSFAPDGRRLAYTPIADAFRGRGSAIAEVCRAASGLRFVDSRGRGRPARALERHDAGVAGEHPVLPLRPQSHDERVTIRPGGRTRCMQITSTPDYACARSRLAEGVLVYEQGGRIT
jgi:hypothetical protein